MLSSVMSETCPRCGITVVPGYVRCPRCQTSLPRLRLRAPADAGGTVVENRRFPVVAVVVPAAVVVGGLIAYLALRGGSKPADDQVEPPRAAAPDPEAATSDDSPAPPTTFAPAPPVRADEVAADLERTLRRRHLWSTVEAATRVVDIRSGSCGDPGLRALVDAAGPRFKAAGLTRLRCLEQSGAVVFTRDL
jgi:hypothetical protein